MLGQSIELSLKAFLILNGVRKNKLKSSFSRDREKLLNEAIKLDLLSLGSLSIAEQVFRRMIGMEVV